MYLTNAHIQSACAYNTYTGKSVLFLPVSKLAHALCTNLAHLCHPYTHTQAIQHIQCVDIAHIDVPFLYKHLVKLMCQNSTRAKIHMPHIDATTQCAKPGDTYSLLCTHAPVQIYRLQNRTYIGTHPDVLAPTPACAHMSTYTCTKNNEGGVGGSDWLNAAVVSTR